MATYIIKIDNGEGGTTRRNFDSMREAETFARQWTKDGDWDYSGVARVTVEGPRTTSEIEVSVTGSRDTE